MAVTSVRCLAIGRLVVERDWRVPFDSPPVAGVVTLVAASVFFCIAEEKRYENGVHWRQWLN